MPHDDDKLIYRQVLDITKHLKRREHKVALMLLLASIGTVILYYLYFRLQIIFLIAVMFSGLSASLIIKRNADVRLGGLSTFPLLLYYTLSTWWIPLHFLVLVVIGLPIGVLLVRRGYIEHMLFYILSIFIFPLAVLSFLALTEIAPQFRLVSDTYPAEAVIYAFLPQVYIYSTLGMNRKRILADNVFFFVALAVGVAIWVGVTKGADKLLGI